MGLRRAAPCATGEGALRLGIEAEELSGSSEASEGESESEREQALSCIGAGGNDMDKRFPLPRSLRRPMARQIAMIIITIDDDSISMPFQIEPQATTLVGPLPLIHPFKRIGLQ
jgi:hypothetical protein